MNEEEMKKLWLEQDLNVRLPGNLLQEISQKGEDLKKEIKKRDRLEELAALAGGSFFLIPFFSHENLFVKIGCILIILFAIEVVIVLRLFRKEPRTEGFSLSEQFKEELRFFRKQRALSEKIVFWYIAPCFVGLTFFAYGLSANGWMFGIHTAFNVFIAVYIYRLNRKAVKERYNPLIYRLEELLAGLAG